jgi:hypothetical protein
MVTAIIVVGVLLLAAVVAVVANKRPPDPPTTPQFATPQQVDRTDFAGATAPWLLALFSSETCLSCHDARASLEPVEFSQVQVQDLPVEQHRALHQRYGIDAVPIVILADAHGVVRWSYLGAPPQEAIRDVLVDIEVLRPDDGTSVSFP